MMIRHDAAILFGAAFITTVAVPAAARPPRSAHYDLPAQDLGTALRQVGLIGHIDIMFAPGDVAGITAPAIRGDMTVSEAIDRLLGATGLTARYAGGSVVIRARSPQSVVTSDNAENSEIVVTGSRIKGAPPAAPVTVITAADIRNAGQSDLGEVARSLPQNFGGGQNPGIGNTQGTANENSNVNGASTFNLRGIGPNATLTLLNGNRLSYSGVSAAVDVSSIPVAAVARVEVVADGASAIYGSDAVAGVVNILLQPDYDGLSTTARIGGSTDGGNFQQQYDIVGGAKWRSGGFLATYDFFRNTVIEAGDRSYASPSNPESTLYPMIKRHSVLLSGHQTLASGVTLNADLIYKGGRMTSASGYLRDQPITFQGVNVDQRFHSAGIAPSVSVDLPSDWTAKMTGFYGVDKTDGRSIFYSNGATSRIADADYDNRSLSLEAGAQGPIVALPAGDVRFAFGVGTKSYRFIADTTTVHVNKTRKNYFGYAELYVPLISPAQGVPIVQRASLTGAVRVEDYSDSSRIATPKLGFVYQPVEALTLKASWGRSFKLPTLYQQYAGYAAVLLPVSGYGSLYPAGSTYVITLGSNDQERAERSENWTLTTELRPLKDLVLSASYFHIDYSDRVAPPLTSTAGVLTNPIYADLVTLSPSAVQIGSIANAASGGLQNGTGALPNLTRVIAILDARDRNIARQLYQGVDLSARYSALFDNGRSLTVTGAATWLRSSQQLIAGAPEKDLAGQLFYPPRFKARGGASFGSDRFSLASFVTYSGGVKDARRSSSVDIESVTTVDLTGRVRIAELFEVSVDALNLFDAKPTQIFTASPIDTPFDTTNYSAVGRYLGLSITRSW